MSETEILKDQEFYEMIQDILVHPEMQKRRTFLHHDDSVYDHCLRVAYIVYQMCKTLTKYHIEVRTKDAVIAGLLHDLYSTPWRDQPKKPLFEKHGFIHAQEACHNAEVYFKQYMNPIVADAITRHMFPLNVTPPKYLESWLVTLADKKDSFSIFKNPAKLPTYVGLNVPVRKLTLRTKKMYYLFKNYYLLP